VPRQNNPYAGLKRIFHEPNRLAIISALCNVVDGLTFNELKEECHLTDGNLSRHLKALEDARVIRIKKSFVKAKPQTTLFLTERGRESFLQYLQSLEEVLKMAAESFGASEKQSASLPFFTKPARA